jgi:hypothetical protein
MPAITTREAKEKLATAVSQARPEVLREIFGELFPTESSPDSPIADELARHVRNGLAPEEVVDLWNVVFPDDHNVWYNEETDEILYNQEVVGYAD